jgi:hypothetical protein
MAMTFLPVVERELRVAARKRSTFWLRIIAALAGLLIGCGCLMLSAVSPLGLNHLGAAMFGTLTWLSVAAALAAGLFLTSDCLSEEKREGTLGFLFLTDLRGYDVVGGKLLATSLRSIFALLALFPILAITLLMGGVTGTQFWKTTLALVNALFCSLAAGMVISAISRDFQKALATTLLLMLLLTAGGPLADVIISANRGSGFIAFWSLLSPGYVFAVAGAWGRTPYWTALAITHAVAWLFLALACLLIPRTWQERSSRAAAALGMIPYSWRYGGTNWRVALRRKLLCRNPVLWLACRERWQSVGIWFLALGAIVAVVWLLKKLDTEVWMVWRVVGGPFILAVYLWAASQACRFFIEARRSGLIELLLSTPISVQEIVRGQWHALRRMFGLPLVLLLSAHLTAVALSQQSWSGLTAQLRGGGAELAVTIAITIATGLATVGNLIALSWVGMWMGMTSKNNNIASLKTILFVQIIPWFAITFISTFAPWLLLLPSFVRSITGSTSSSAMIWHPLLNNGLDAVLTLGKDVAFIVWARRQLYFSFRQQAVRNAGPNPIALAPLPPMAVSSPPPVIANHQSLADH